jgi:hypothetical protein
MVPMTDSQKSHAKDTIFPVATVFGTVFLLRVCIATHRDMRLESLDASLEHLFLFFLDLRQ